MKEVVDKRLVRRYSMVAPSGMNVPVIRSVITKARPVIELPFLIAKALFRVHMLNRLIAEGNSPIRFLANPTYTRWQEVYNDPTNKPGIRRNVEWQLYQTILHELAVVGFTIPGNDRWSVTVKLSNKQPDVYDVFIHPVAMTVIRKYPDSTMGLTTAFDKLALVAELISNGYNPHDLGIEQ